MDNKELLKAMSELNTAMQKISILMGYAGEQTQNNFSTAYPFNKSFDEVAYDVMTWTQNFKNMENLKA